MGDAASLGHHRLGDLPSQPPDVFSHLRRFGDVGGERLLPAASLGDMGLVDEGRVVTAEAEDAQVWADRRAEVPGEQLVVGPGEVLHRDDAELPEAGGGAVADAPDLRHRLRAEAWDPFAASEHRHAARFGPSRCGLGEEAGLADADGA